MLSTSKQNKRAICVRNLPSTVTKEELLNKFGKFGNCVSCDLNVESISAYIEFESEESVAKALAMDNVEMGSVISCKQATDQHDSETKSDVTSQTPIQIFIGGIGSNVDENVLREGFSKFGKIVEVKFVRQADGTHKGYAFVSYNSESEAETAINTMNNTMFHNKKIQCNWAAKNNPIANSHAAINGSNSWEFGQKTTEKIATDPQESNTSVYVVAENLTEEILKSAFAQFGKIKNIKSFPEKNHAFVNYESHDSAANAIQQMNGQTTNNGIELKCSWGKKSSDQNGFFNANQFYFNNYPGGQFDQFYGANYAMGQYMGQQYGMANAARVAPMVPGYYNNMQFGGTVPQQNRFQSHAKPLNNFVAHRQMRTNHPYRAPLTRPNNQVGANTNSNQQNQLQ